MTVLDINEIKKILPHRYPMLLVDRILEIEPISPLTKYNFWVISPMSPLCREYF